MACDGEEGVVKRADSPPTWRGDARDACRGDLIARVGLFRADVIGADAHEGPGLGPVECGIGMATFRVGDPHEVSGFTNPARETGNSRSMTIISP